MHANTAIEYYTAVTPLQTFYMVTLILNANILALGASGKAKQTRNAIDGINEQSWIRKHQIRIVLDPRADVPSLDCANCSPIPAHKVKSRRNIVAHGRLSS